MAAGPNIGCKCVPYYFRLHMCYYIRLCVLLYLVACATILGCVCYYIRLRVPGAAVNSGPKGPSDLQCVPHTFVV